MQRDTRELSRFLDLGRIWATLALAMTELRFARRLPRYLRWKGRIRSFICPRGIILRISSVALISGYRLTSMRTADYRSLIEKSGDFNSKSLNKALRLIMAS